MPGGNGKTRKKPGSKTKKKIYPSSGSVGNKPYKSKSSKMAKKMMGDISY
jgi:hypothetical protein